MGRYPDEYDYWLDHDYDEDEREVCVICNAYEEDTTLYEGLCIDCLFLLFNSHIIEIIEWSEEKFPSEEGYDNSEEGCRESYLEDDPQYFAEWIVNEHPEWITEARRMYGEY